MRPISFPADGRVPPRKILDHGIPRGFSPDGKWLLVLTNPNEISVSPAEIGADGVKLGQPVLFTKLIGGSSNPNFSPDGRWIVYSSNDSGGPQVYARPFHGTGEKYQISTGGGYFPVWSRSGLRSSSICNLLHHGCHLCRQRRLASLRRSAAVVQSIPGGAWRIPHVRRRARRQRAGADRGGSIEIPSPARAFPF